MVRMWGVSPELMCNNHLLGEHNELHMIVGTIRKHPHGEAIVRGHAEKGQVDTSLIQKRHEELADEMNSRGFEHKSPLEYDDEFGIGAIDAERDPSLDTRSTRDELADRCEDCRKRILEDSEK